MTMVNEQQLLKMYLTYKNRENHLTKREQLEMNYIEKCYNYLSLKNMAIREGNKTPNDNFLIKDCYDEMVKAHDILANYDRG